MGKRIQVGERSGHLVILSEGVRRTDLASPGAYTFLCLCEKCGKTAQITNIQFRRRTMCNACSALNGADLRSTHGHSKKTNKNRLYGAWQTMNARCHNPNSTSYRWYGAKGVRVCDEWRDYEVFRDWAMSHGYGPGMTLDRLDETKGYEPGNCEYVSKPENSRRARAKYHFVKKTDVLVVYAHPYDEPTYGDY